MKNDTTYNGWTNKVTWNINLMFQELFTNMCEEQKFDDVDHLADAFQSIVEEQELDPVTDHTMAYWALDQYLSEVNWTEIAEHYAADFDLFEDEEVERLNH